MGASFRLRFPSLRSSKTLYLVFMNNSSSIGEQPLKGRRWDFLTNHAHVLLCVADDPGIRLRDIAAAVGITERAAHKILSDLVDDGYVTRERTGRRNHYMVRPELRLRHPLVQKRQVGDLLNVLLSSKGAAA